MNILDKIVAAKLLEVARRKAETPLSKLTQNPAFKEACFSLKRALKKKDSTGIIAEHKRKSPSLGWIRQNSDVAEVAQAPDSGTVWTQPGARVARLVQDVPLSADRPVFDQLAKDRGSVGFDSSARG